MKSWKSGKGWHVGRISRIVIVSSAIDIGSNSKNSEIKENIRMKHRNTAKEYGISVIPVDDTNDINENNKSSSNEEGKGDKD